MKQPSITKKDFDAAVKQPWSRTTCVAAQMIKRVTGKFPDDRWEKQHVSKIWDFASSSLIDRTVLIFDKHFKQPGDEHKPELQALRSSLPIRLE